MNRQMLETKLAEKRKNQRQMCDDIGMPPQRLSEMKEGRLHGWKYRSRICRYLGILEEELFPEDGNEQEPCHDKSHIVAGKSESIS